MHNRITRACFTTYLLRVLIIPAALCSLQY